MSLRGKDFRCELDPELHERLRKMAEFENVSLLALTLNWQPLCVEEVPPGWVLPPARC